jgi:DNA-binding transcriptional MocR family regulator
MSKFSKSSSDLPGMFVVMLAIRDSHVAKGAQQALLYALALRARPEKHYTCLPSYAQLSQDTGLHGITLQRAAAELESRSLIRRGVRRNTSNVYQINVALILELAGAERVKMKAAKAARLEATLNSRSEKPGFAMPQPIVKDVDDVDEIDEVEEEGEVEDYAWEKRAN